MKITGYESENGKVTAVIITDETRGFYDKRFIEDRPHGEWVLDAVSPCSISWFRCSYCGYKYEAYKQSNFCPNCGASMVKEGEAE